MKTECTSSVADFTGVGNRKVEIDFDGGHLSSDGGVLLLRDMDERLALMERLSGCFTDYRDPDLIEHGVDTLLRQRVFGIALGYEDLNDHDALRVDPLLALAAGKSDLEGKERRCEQDRGKALASSSTLNRLELTPLDAGAGNRYKKLVYDGELIENLLVDVFLESFDKAPKEIILDFDATDDPIHGTQEGRFFHGYYGNYCYLPLYVTCGQHLLVAQLRTSDKDASAGSLEVFQWLVKRIRERFPQTSIIFRGDSGFTRDAIMAWCELDDTVDVYYLLGLAKNQRLLKLIEEPMFRATVRSCLTGAAAREFTSFYYQTLDSWDCPRRVIGKAECLPGKANPRFIVTNLPRGYATPTELYEQGYCARGDMENRIKEQQMDLFADRTSANTMRANQLRLWFSSLAYVLLSHLRTMALKGTTMAQASCGTIRTKLFKIAAQVKISVRRVVVHLPTAYPFRDLFMRACRNLRSMPQRS